MSARPHAGEAPARVAAFLPQICDGESTHSYALLSLCEHMSGSGLELELHAQCVTGRGRRPFVRAAVPPWLRRPYYRLDREGRLAAAASALRYRQALRGADAAYVWAGTPESVYRDAAASGVPLVVERVNCHRATSVPILEEAYRRAGLGPAHGITEASLAEERRKLALADWIFAPSPPVRRSLLDDGIPDERILPVSYGWSPHRVEPRDLSAPPSGPPVFLFVGTVCVRKGAHLLLEAWSEARVNGRLDVCGPVLPEIQATAGALLARPGVNHRGPVRPFARAAAGAEVFAFPTLEEGSSLAVLEAMATGLALLTTPMGAGEIVRHGREGLVLDPYDRPAWVAALRQLADDPALRLRLASAAHARAQEFTWEKAGAKRRRLLLEALERRGAAAPARAGGAR
jgi:glycosyltransferase involved in cell wall biosynthesis